MMASKSVLPDCYGKKLDSEFMDTATSLPTVPVR
jgi:hypothetical protein